jgi:hypothetical protein
MGHVRAMVMLAAGILAIVLPPRPAHAEAFSIVIRDGAVDAGGGPFFRGARLGLRGTGGFRLGGVAADGPSPLAFCSPCLPGEVISLSASMNSLGGEIRYRGRTHEFSFARGDGGALDFETDSFVLPRAATLPSDIAFRVPFRMEGWAAFQYEPAAPQVSFDFRGTGMATAHYTIFPFDLEHGGQQYVLNSLVYQFGDTAPVPEPGTLVLLGSGLAMAAAKARRRRTH